jgi:hypothetical protein
MISSFAHKTCVIIPFITNICDRLIGNQTHTCGPMDRKQIDRHTYIERTDKEGPKGKVEFKEETERETDRQNWRLVNIPSI